MVLTAPFPRIAAYTFRRQVPAEICTGLVAGVSSLAGFAALKSLGAPDWAPQVIAVAGQSIWLFAPGLEAFVAHLDARRAFLWLGLVANVPLIALLFLPVERTGPDGAGTGLVLPFVAAIVVLTALDALYLPLRGALVRANYPDAVRGRYFTRLTAIARSATIVSSKAAGWLLHDDPRFLRVVFPLAGVVGLVEHALLARIRLHRTENPSGVAGEGSAVGRFAEALREGVRVLARDAAFRTYEVAFMLYGLGFAMSHSLVPAFAKDEMRLGYDEFTWAQGVAEPVAYLLTGLALGRVLARAGLVRLTAAAFLSLAVFFTALVFVRSPAQYIALWVLFGATMSAVNIGWNLGPLQFAPTGQARAYASIHVCLVGARIAVGPFLGYGLSRWIGTRTVFGVSAALVAAGSIVAWRLARRTR